MSARIELEIFVNDMVTFDRPIPDGFFAGTTINKATLKERLVPPTSLFKQFVLGSTREKRKI